MPRRSPFAAVALLLVLPACGPHLRWRDHATRAFSVSERCTQGPLVLDLPAAGARWGERIEVRALSPRAVLGRAAIITSDDPPSDVPFGQARMQSVNVGGRSETVARADDHPDNARCVATAAELSAPSPSPGGPAPSASPPRAAGRPWRRGHGRNARRTHRRGPRRRPGHTRALRPLEHRRHRLGHRDLLPRPVDQPPARREAPREAVVPGAQRPGRRALRGRAPRRVAQRLGRRVERPPPRPHRGDQPQRRPRPRGVPAAHRALHRPPRGRGLLGPRRLRRLPPLVHGAPSRRGRGGRGP